MITMTDFTPEVCHYFGETRDCNAKEIKALMALAAPIIVSKGDTDDTYMGGRRKRYTYKGVTVIEDCFGEYVIKVPEDSNGYPDRRYLEAIINNSEVHPIIIGCNVPPRV